MKPYIDCKWPGLLVVGDRISEDLACEIIIRTTIWPLNSNDRDFDLYCNNLVGSSKEFSKYLSRLNVLDLYYLHNECISTNWIGGYRGWLGWDGVIFCNNYNIGKYPSIEEITIDWRLISKTFPFLNLRCQVLSGELGEDDIFPTCEWKICGGKVEIIFPTEQLVEVGKIDYNLFNINIYPDIRPIRGIENSRCTNFK